MSTLHHPINTTKDLDDASTRIHERRGLIERAEYLKQATYPDKPGFKGMVHLSITPVASDGVKHSHEVWFLLRRYPEVVALADTLGAVILEKLTAAINAELASDIESE